MAAEAELAYLVLNWNRVGDAIALSVLKLDYICVSREGGENNLSRGNVLTGDLCRLVHWRL
jgi:hypothetical protein